MKAEARRTLRSFLVELVIYGLFVVVYFFLVLHFLGPSFVDLHNKSTALYALLCVVLILGQAVLLEWITTTLFRLLRGRSE